MLRGVALGLVLAVAEIFVRNFRRRILTLCKRENGLARSDERNTTMNKAIQKMMLALAVCGALCGTAMAAPKGNQPPKGKAPTAMKAQSPKATKPAPAKQVAKAPAHQTAKAPAHGNAHHTAPTKHELRHEVAHHNPPPPAHHHEPKHHHHDHHSGTLHTEDWCEIGASLIGGLIGGLIGAAS